MLLLLLGYKRYLLLLTNCELNKQYSYKAVHKSASSTEYEPTEEAEASGPEAEESSSAALERLARAGHWQRCLAHAAARAPHYALRYAAHMFKAHPVTTYTSLHIVKEL